MCNEHYLVKITLKLKKERGWKKSNKNESLLGSRLISQPRFIELKKQDNNKQVNERKWEAHTQIHTLTREHACIIQALHLLILLWPATLRASVSPLHKFTIRSRRIICGKLGLSSAYIKHTLGIISMPLMNPTAFERNVGGPPKRVKYVWLSRS